MIRLVRLFSRLGLRWVVFGAIARFLARRFGQATVERAGRDLEAKAQERLPAPVAKAVAALPPEAINVGGTAVVAGRAMKGAVSTTRRAGQLAGNGTRRAGAGVEAVKSLADEIRAESESGTRRLRARYLDATMGPGAATDALLDVRSSGGPDLDLDDPHDTVPDPVARGRRRARRSARPLVDRVRRQYRPEPKAWDER